MPDSSLPPAPSQDSSKLQIVSDQVAHLTSAVADVPLYQLSPITGDIRVLPVSNCQLLGTQQANGATSVAIGWVNPTDPNIDRFEVWVQRSAYTGENPYLVAALVNSPATFTVTADQGTVVIATVVTVLKNGLRTDFSSSPTVTFNVSTTVTSVPAANITAGTLNAGVIYSGTINCSQLNAGTINVALALTAATLTGSTLTLNSGGVTTTVDNHSVAGIGVVGMEVQNNSSGDGCVVSSLGASCYNTDPANGKLRAGFGTNGSGGIVKVYDGSGSGQLGGGARVVMDGTNGNISFNGVLAMTGTNRTTANAGAATLPANPVGFFDFVFNGTTYKIPYYNA